MPNTTWEQLTIERLEGEVEELKQQVKKYRLDELTGLKMRIDFNKDFKDLFDSGKPFYLVIADVNGLKNANTKDGYEGGDILLKKCANDLIRCNPMGGQNIYRYSGDEFCILFEFNRGFRSEDFDCPSDEFTIASKCSTDYEDKESLFKATNNLLLERKATYYVKKPNERRIN